MELLERMREKFKDDKFAMRAGISIDSVENGQSQCSMAITPDHLNANGFVMGGAIFTLADFSFAVAANSGEVNAVSLSSQINFVSAARGPKLTAVALCRKGGRKICFYEVSVYEGDKLIATGTVTGYQS